MLGIPIIFGVLITAVDVVLVLLLMHRGFRALEAFVIALLLVIFGCFVVQIVLAAPPLQEVLCGFVPRWQVVADPQALYLAIGIVGATVMPHNLYLHSSIVQTRAYPRTPVGRRSALRWAVADSTLALMLALFINASILILAAAVFHRSIILMWRKSSRRISCSRRSLGLVWLRRCLQRHCWRQGSIRRSRRRWQGRS